METSIMTFFRTVLPALCITLATATIARVQSSGGPSGTQAREQSAIAFDQIDRVLLHGVAPPVVPSFAADADAIASLPPLKVTMPGAKTAVAQSMGNMLVGTALGFVPFAGPFLGGVASRGMNAAEQALLQHDIEKNNAAVARFISAGILSRFAFYHGWLRSEQRNEITIVKPDQGLTLILHPANKTVQVIDSRRGSEIIEVDTTASLPPSLVGEPVTERLADETVAGVQTHGYRTRAIVKVKVGMGWCAGGQHTVTLVEYVADISDPQPPVAVTAAQSLADACAPTSTVSNREPGHLVLYRSTSIDLGTPKGITLMFERGNLRPLDENGVSLFSVPADFKKEQQ
jgi:hypothetical protein